MVNPRFSYIGGRDDDEDIPIHRHGAHHLVADLSTGWCPSKSFVVQRCTDSDETSFDHARERECGYITDRRGRGTIIDRLNL